MLLNISYRAQIFALPCGFAPTPGHLVASGFIRTAFHDMAPANNNTGIGGLDGSIGFELEGDYAVANAGLAFNATITYYSRFYNSQASVSDLIALGLYSSVRGCGGPAVKIKAGRIDATQAGPLGAPLTTDSESTFVLDFARMGFSPTEMIQVVACGHTMGGVHSAEFPQRVPNGTTPQGVANFDSAFQTFDNKVAVEYMNGSSQDVLIIGLAMESRSDLRAFASDGNITIKSMTSPTTFTEGCAGILQKMIEVVPAGVQLSASIVPYDVKPGHLQLSVIEGGDLLEFTGEIRVRTTQLGASSIVSVLLTYQSRNGSQCSVCTISTSVLGTAAGFDDSFTVGASKLSKSIL
jgi:Peroxidase